MEGADEWKKSSSTGRLGANGFAIIRCCSRKREGRSRALRRRRRTGLRWPRTRVFGPQRRSRAAPRWGPSLPSPAPATSGTPTGSYSMRTLPTSPTPASEGSIPTTSTTSLQLLVVAGATRRSEITWVGKFELEHLQDARRRYLTIWCNWNTCIYIAVEMAGVIWWEKST